MPDQHIQGVGAITIMSNCRQEHNIGYDAPKTYIMKP